LADTVNNLFLDYIRQAEFHRFAQHRPSTAGVVHLLLLLLAAVLLLWLRLVVRITVFIIVISCELQAVRAQMQLPTAKGTHGTQQGCMMCAAVVSISHSTHMHSST
jgi:hypothetical protein